MRKLLAPSKSAYGAPSLLNPAFCKIHRIVPVSMAGGVLTVHAEGELDREILEALEFASGCRIQVIPRSNVEALPLTLLPSVNGIDGLSRPSVSPSFGEVAISSSERRQSLIEHIAGSFAGSGPPTKVFSPIARLLSAGFSPLEAGLVVENMPGGDYGVDQQAREIAASLARGETIERAFSNVPRLPEWVLASLPACPDEAAQASVLVKMDAIARDSDRRVQRVWLAALEMACLWVPLVVLWFVLSPPLGFLAAIAAALFGFSLRRHSGTDNTSLTLRIDVLLIVAMLVHNRVGPSTAIRISMLRLDQRLPTWGSLPDTREGLARALGLDHLQTAILLKGDLCASVMGLAREFAERADLERENLQSVSRAAGIFLLLAAILGLLT